MKTGILEGLWGVYYGLSQVLYLLLSRDLDFISIEARTGLDISITMSGIS